MDKLLSLVDELESHIDKYQYKNEQVSNSTVAWQIEHTLLTINMIINAVKKSDPNQYKWELNFKKILIMNILNKFPRGRAKAPKVVQPEDNISKESIKEHIKISRENILLLKTFKMNHFFIHPFFGKLNLESTIHFLEMHTNHHLQIIKDIVKTS